MAPRPDVRDAIESVHVAGVVPDAAVRTAGPLTVLVGSHREAMTHVSREEKADLLETVAVARPAVIVDAGPMTNGESVLGPTTRAVLVVDASPIGIVRAARLAAAWTGPQPSLVLNRVPPRRPDDAISAARRWTGLEPTAVITEQPRIAVAARSGALPPRSLRTALVAVAAEVMS